MRSILITILCLLLLSACKKDDKKDTIERTILVYMAADNDLTTYTTPDIREMMTGSQLLNKRQKLVLFVDKRGQKPYLLEVARGDTTRLMTFKDELKSSDASTLQTVLSEVMNRYPSQSYGLVLWGHADGWIYKELASQASSSSRTDEDASASQPSRPQKAYGLDINGGYTWMNIPEMADALSTLPPLDFIFADCCAFQSVETAYELRNVTDYIIASPAEIPGEGAPYETVVPAMFNNDPEYCRLVVDAYFAQTINGMREPLSVIKTSAMEPLAVATRQALTSFVPQLENNHYPDVNGLVYYFDCSLFDMNDFILRYADTAEYEAWRKVFDEAVPYRVYARRWIANHVTFSDFNINEERYGGVNMFVPQNVTSVASKYADNITRQNMNISKMQWYQAAGLDALGW